MKAMISVIILISLLFTSAKARLGGHEQLAQIDSIGVYPVYTLYSSGEFDNLGIDMEEMLRNIEFQLIMNGIPVSSKGKMAVDLNSIAIEIMALKSANSDFWTIHVNFEVRRSAHCIVSVLRPGSESYNEGRDVIYLEKFGTKKNCHIIVWSWPTIGFGDSKYLKENLYADYIVPLIQKFCVDYHRAN